MIALNLYKHPAFGRVRVVPFSDSMGLMRGVLGVQGMQTLAEGLEVPEEWFTHLALGVWLP